jgi:serine protease Do
MIRKLFALSLFFIFSVFSVMAQDAPQPERVYRALTLSGSGGSYLGVQTLDVTKENYSRFGLSEVRGVAIDKVLKDSPAEKAGLQANDVIVGFDGESVTSVRKLTRLVSEVAPDHKVTLTVLRGGSERKVEVTLGKRDYNFDVGSVFGGELPKIENFPELENLPNIMPRAMTIPRGGDGSVFVWSASSNRQIGVTLTGLTNQLAEYFGVPDGKGLLISDVRADSPAAKAGLKAGDVIVEIDGQKVERTTDLIRALNEKKEGSVSITVIRNKNRQTFTVEPQKPVNPNLLLPGRAVFN